MLFDIISTANRIDKYTVDKLIINEKIYIYY